VSERVCFQLSVRPDRLDEYKARHREVWPEMLDALRLAGWRNYSLFLRPLIGYLECEDFEAARRAMDETDVNARWQADMAVLRAPRGRPTRYWVRAPQGDLPRPLEDKRHHWLAQANHWLVQAPRISATPTAPGGSPTIGSGRPPG
jgi:L-rhamnose mutarotase